MIQDITPLPWGVRVAECEGVREVEILGANEQTIACNSPDSPTPISEVDAVAIVCAVNNHGPLLALVEDFMHYAGTDPRGVELWRRGRAIIKGMEPA